MSAIAFSFPECRQISFPLKNNFFSASVLAQTPTEGKIQADQLLQQGIQEFNNNQFQAAIASWQQALNLYREISDRPGEGEVLFHLGFVYASLGEYSTAIEYHQQQLTIAQNLRDRANEGIALNHLGAAYRNIGEYATAIQYHQQSLAIARSLGDRALEGWALNHLGSAHRLLGEYSTAIEYHQQSLAIAQKIDEQTLEGNALNALGLAYWSLSEYSTAIEYHQQSLAIVREIGDRTLQGNTLNSLGIAYQNLNEYGIAIDYYQESLIIAREVGNRASEARILNNLGLAYQNLNDDVIAIDCYEGALSVAQDIGDRALEGRVLNNLGLIYQTLNEYATALDYYQQALTIAREIGNRPSEGRVLNNLGLIYQDLGKYNAAIEYTQQSLSIAREIGDRDGEGIALNNLGLAFLNSGQRNEAEATLRQAIEVWETIRELLGDNNPWKVSIFEQQARTYRLLEVVLVAQNRVEDALEISERGRARAFVELMAQRLGNDSEMTVKVDIPNVEQIKQVAQQQNATLVEYSLIFNQFLYIWVIQPTGEIAFRSVNLARSEILLPEVVERGHITAASTRIRGLDETEALLTDMVRGTHDSLENTNVARQSIITEPRINPNLQQLHQLLIEPIADLLPSDPNQKVIFIPQGSLFLVPFPALQDKTGTYLIEKYTILTAPAIQVLQLTQQQEINQNNAILIVGNPTMPKVSIAPHQPPQQLNSLPGTELEASAIASLLNTDFLSGDRATETTIKQKMPGAKLIHLATHGLLEETDNGLLAAIALTPSNSDDGLLTPDEILALQLSADLVVLSACDTGRGKITGDGVLGLSRSILTAGARSAIVSLWKVPDLQTSVLMSEFYRQWQQTGNKAQALRQAMLTTMEQYPHPMNWAAFTIMGESN